MSSLLIIAERMIDEIFNESSRLHPVFILSMIVIGLVVYVWRNPKVNFFSWMFPKNIYFHPSHLTDVKLFIFGRLLVVGGLLNVTILNTIIVYYALAYFGQSEAIITQFAPILVGIIFLIVADFCTYWVHRLHHTWKIIWPFHAVHHSAEVMTPITAYRKHPLYDLFSGTFKAIIIGLVQGIVLCLFVGKISMNLLLSMSGLYYIFNLLGSNLRHSHIWLSYGSFLEHIFISPAQHQIHHSLTYKHWHKNYGEIFAIWDWIFGTLYIPDKYEKLSFGLSDVYGRRIEQPYPNLTDALCKPIRESWAEICGQKIINTDNESIYGELD